MRKDLDLKVEETINVYIETTSRKIANTVKEYIEFIREKVRAEK